MLKNIRLVISYDGTDYCGWQKQNNAITIQNVMENCISKIIKEDVNLVASGRTDSKVHALGQVANFKMNCNIPVGNLVRAINSVLPDDIRVLNAEEVNVQFSARFSSKKKTYLYKIYNDEIFSPFYSRYSTFIPYKLDIGIMKQALELLVGEHDFRAFMSSGSGVKNTIRTIYSVNLLKKDSIIEIEITGNGFLYNMVRIIVGTIIEIGNEKRNINCIKDAFIYKDRSLLGKTAKPEGLFLRKVIY